MELLIPIVLLFFILLLCMRFLLGERIYEDVMAKFVYGFIKGCIMFPFRLCATLLRLVKIK